MAKKSYLKFSKFNYAWEVTNDKGQDLGHIEYYNTWRQHVWVSPVEFQINMSAGCLQELKTFIDELNRTKGAYKVGQ